MQDIVNAVRRVTDLMSEITAATQEQSHGIEQVNETVTNLDDMTQQNAALVEQAAAAAESLEEQAQNLTTSVAAFRLQRSSSRMALQSPSRAAHSPAPRPVPARPAARLPVAASERDDEWEEF